MENNTKNMINIQNIDDFFSFFNVIPFGMRLYRCTRFSVSSADAGGGVQQAAVTAGTGAGYGKIDKDKIDNCADRILTGFLKLT